MIRFFIALTLTILLSPLAKADLKYSATSPSLDQVRALKDKLGPVLMQLKGLNGYGITACDSKSGLGFAAMAEQASKTAEFENCMEVYAETQEAADALLKLSPVGNRIDGIYVDVMMVGNITVEKK